MLADALAARGTAPAGIGAVFTLALLAGAAWAAACGTLVRRFGVRATYVTSGLAMVLAAPLLGLGAAAAALGALLGVVSPGGQDVGPCAAIEQAALADAPGGLVRRLAWYNLAGALALAFGALTAAVVPLAGVLALYAAAGLVTAVAGFRLPPASAGGAVGRSRRFGVAERLAALFALDAFAGGFVVQGFIAYWLTVRFGAGPALLGPLFFGANLLAAASYLLADRLAVRIGLLRTMAFTHLPSNVLLCAIPFAPSLGAAAGLLLARFALSQMDVPTRQAYTVSLVAPSERARAAGITAAVRPAAASIAPVLTGIAFQLAALGLPFIVAGGLKIVYDLTLLAAFRNTALHPGKASGE